VTLKSTAIIDFIILFRIYINKTITMIKLIDLFILEKKSKNVIPVKVNRYIYHTSNPIFRDKINSVGLIPQGKSEAWLTDTKIDGKVIFAVNSDNKKDWWDSTYDDDIYQIDTTGLNNTWERNEEKERMYGQFIEGMEQTARIASEMSRKEITTQDAYNVLIALKLSRASWNYKYDNYLDAIAYMASLDQYLSTKK